MGSYKIVTRQTTLGACIEDAYAEFQALRDEAEEICDNMPESLQQTERYEAFDTNRNELGNYCDNPPDVAEPLQEIKVSYMEETKKGSISRARRCNNACAMLEAVIEELDSSEHEDAESIAEEIAQMKDAAESLEWPGMFG